MPAGRIRGLTSPARLGACIELEKILNTSNMPARITIVGGGLAGLAAAVALTERGLPCTLLESRGRLGGRASSFHDPTTDTDVDNCQHVTLGCCTNFRHFCQTTGLAEFFRREKMLHFIARDGKINPFQATFLPAPFHLGIAFGRLSYLTLADKLALARGLKELARPVSPDDESRPFSEWLKRHRQTDAAIHKFWFVVLVSALSESLDRISVSHARKVFIDAFLAHRDGWCVDIPVVPLEELYGGRLTEWLTARGTTIRCLASASQIEMEHDRVTAVRLASGEVVAGDEFVVALPFFRVMSVLPPAIAKHPSLRGIDQLQAAPISSIHLWFDRSITELPHAVFVDRLCQWMFNRTVIGSATDSKSMQGQPGLDGAHYYQIVISASQELAGQSRDEILRVVLQELTETWPGVANANLIHSRQITEHRAVFSPVPGVDALRPRQQSPVGNLQLAGDWTDTGWPATMEGAVRSGYLAAENILSRLGQKETVLQPDLHVAFNSRLLFGLRKN